jgi:transcriptional regulator with XRE-family HTH domain
MTINAHALKIARKRQNLSQQQLAESAAVSKKTIARIENRRSQPNATTTKRIAKALKVDPAVLAREPDPRRVEQDFPEQEHQRIAAYVSGEAALAFQIIESRYLLPARLQVRMAPLLISLLAEASLKWRREKLEGLKKARAETWFAGGPVDPFAEIIEDEERSVSSGDATGELLEVIDHPFADPFLEFLLEFKSQVGEEDFELFSATDPEGYYQYRVSDQTLERWSQGDRLIERALRRGYLKLTQTHFITDILRSGASVAFSPAERAERIRSQIPPEIRANLEAELAAESREEAEGAAANEKDKEHA